MADARPHVYVPPILGAYRNIYLRPDGTERHGATWRDRETAESMREVLEGETFLELRDMSAAADLAPTGTTPAKDPEEEPTICACGEPIRDGDKVYTCQSSGVVHAECMGTDPENFPGPDGEPRKPGDPIPEPWVYSTGEAAR